MVAGSPKAPTAVGAGQGRGALVAARTRRNPPCGIFLFRELFLFVPLLAKRKSGLPNKVTKPL